MVKETKAKTKLLRRRQWIVALSSAVAALLLVLGGVYAYGKVSEESIVPGLAVGSVQLGNQNVADALVAVQTAADKLTNVRATVNGKDYTLALADYGLAVDAHATANEALAVGVRSRPLVAGWVRLTHLFGSASIPAVVTIDDLKLEQASNAFADQVGVGRVDAQITYKKGAWVVVPSKAGQGIEPSVLADQLLAQVRRLSTGPIQLQTSQLDAKITTQTAQGLLPTAEGLVKTPLTLTAADQKYTVSSAQMASWVTLVPGDNSSTPASVSLDHARVAAYVASLAKGFDTDPQDARVTFADGQVKTAQLSQDGRALDQAASTAAILAAFSHPDQRDLTLAVTVKKPEVSSDALASLGIKELIGSATTSYIGSPANRVHNIANGVKFLTGILVKPGSEFSTVAALGTVDNTTGYLPELVIKDNATEPEYGGGLCQVSTTLFRAAMNAGLKITARTNHSYRVPYYERGVGPGLDATIYLPKPDFKFFNNTSGWILIQAYLTPDQDEVTFELYGTSDGRRAVVDKPVVYDVQPAPPPVYVQTNTLPAGTTKKTDTAHPGAKTTVDYKVYKADGSLMFSQTFNSAYQPWPARYLVGTAGAQPSPSPSPTPTGSPTSPSSPIASASPSATASSSPSASSTPTAPANS